MDSGNTNSPRWWQTVLITLATATGGAWLADLMGIASEDPGRRAAGIFIGAMAGTIVAWYVTQRKRGQQGSKR